MNVRLFVRLPRTRTPKEPFLPSYVPVRSAPHNGAPGYHAMSPDKAPMSPPPGRKEGI